VARSNVDDRTQWTVTAWWQLQRSLPVQSRLPDNVLHWAAYRKARRWPLRPDDGPIVIGLRSSTRACSAWTWYANWQPWNSPPDHRAHSLGAFRAVILPGRLKMREWKCRVANVWKAEPKLYRETALSYFIENVLRRLTEGSLNFIAVYNLLNCVFFSFANIIIILFYYYCCCIMYLLPCHGEIKIIIML